METKENWNINQDQSGSFCKPQKCTHGITMPRTLTNQIMVSWNSEEKLNHDVMTEHLVNALQDVFACVCCHRNKWKKSPFLNQVVLVQLHVKVESYFQFCTWKKSNQFTLFICDIVFFQNGYGKNATTTTTFDFWHFTLQSEARWPGRKQHHGAHRAHRYRTCYILIFICRMWYKRWADGCQNVTARQARCIRGCYLHFHRNMIHSPTLSWDPYAWW